MAVDESRHNPFLRGVNDLYVVSILKPYVLG
jgi:hypothetical protein